MHGDEERWARGGEDLRDLRSSWMHGEEGDNGKDELQELPWFGFGNSRRREEATVEPTVGGAAGPSLCLLGPRLQT